MQSGHTCLAWWLHGEDGAPQPWRIAGWASGFWCARSSPLPKPPLPFGYVQRRAWRRSRGIAGARLQQQLAPSSDGGNRAALAWEGTAARGADGGNSLTSLGSHSGKRCSVADCWAEAHVKNARMTLTIKLDGTWSSFQPANSAPPLSVIGSAIAPSARMRVIAWALG